MILRYVVKIMYAGEALRLRSRARDRKNTEREKNREDARKTRAKVGFVRLRTVVQAVVSRTTAATLNNNRAL